MAALTATFTSCSAVRTAYRDLFTSLDGPPCLEATAPGLAPFPFDDSAPPVPIPGVTVIDPRIRATAALLGKAGAVPTVVIGTDRCDTVAALGSGRLLRGDDEVLLPPGIAEANDLRLGGTVRLWTSTGPADLHLVGLLEPRGEAGANGGAVAVVTLSAARRLFALPGRVNALHLLMARDADPSRIPPLLEGRLPVGVAVSEDHRGDLARTTLRSVELGLTGLGAVSFVTCAFVLLNGFLLHHDERRRLLATLRAVGATRAQVLGLLLREALLLGLGGTVLGLGSGLGLAFLMSRAMGDFLGVSVPAPVPTAGALLPAALLGPATVLAAAWFPAFRASRRPPLGELLDRPCGPEQGLPAWTAFLGLWLLTLAGLGVAAATHDWLFQETRLALVAPVVGLLTAGGVLVLPPGSRWLLAAWGRMPRGWLGIEGNLALGQLTRYPARTGLTAGVLFVAVVMAVAFGQLLRNTLDDLRCWYRRSIPADFLVRGAMPDSTLLLAPALPEGLGSELTALDGVDRVDRVAFLPARVNGRQVLVLARSFAPDRPPPLDIRDGDPAAVLAGVRSGGAVLDAGLARALGVGTGDRVTLETAAGDRPIRVAGTVTEYAAGGDALYLEWETARGLLPLPGVHAFLVTARTGRTAAAAAALRGHCDIRGLLLQDNDDLRTLIDHALDRVAGALWAMTALAFLIASLGVANTVVRNVRQQRREFGVLRAVGLTRRQMRRVVLWQALLTALVGVLPGTLAGVGTAYLLGHLSNTLLGRQVPLGVEPGLVGGAFVLAVASALLAALAPAVRSSRLDVLQAIRA